VNVNARPARKGHCRLSEGISQRQNDALFDGEADIMNI